MARTLTNKWPEERIERLKELWADLENKPVKIAEELGLSRNAVIGMAYRLGLTKRERDYETAAWPPEDVDLLKQLWDAPERYSQLTIAIRMGKTRSAVSNKAKQLGLKDREPPKQKRSTQVLPDGRIIQFPMKRRTSERKPARKTNAEIFAERYPVSEVDVIPLHIGFMELNDSVCKFECSDQDDPRLFSFCGHPSVKDRPYCSDHCRIAYQPLPDRGRKPIIELSRARGGIFGRVA